MADGTPFQPIDDPKEAELLLKEALLTHASTVCWTRNQDNSIKTHVCKIDSTRYEFHAWMPAEKGGAEFVRELQTNGIQDCFFNILLNRASVFFKARFKEHDPVAIHFHLPSKIYKVQRRLDQRIQLPETSAVHVEIRDPADINQNISKRAVDISTGGLAFLVQIEEAVFFAPGTLLSSLKFVVQSRSIIVDAEIKHAKNVANANGTAAIRVGIQFRKISRSDSEFLSNFISSESRKLFQRTF